MPPSLLDYLRHILDEADFLASRTSDLTRGQFMTDETAKRAFVRSIEIIGEATKKVPTDVRQRYPNAEWRAITGVRDKVVNDYFGVDYEIIWDVAENKVPQLREQVEYILNRESSG